VDVDEEDLLVQYLRYDGEYNLAVCIPITGLNSGEVSVRILLVLFCVPKRGVFWPHSGEGLPITGLVGGEVSVRGALVLFCV